ncbi:hypothetical protein AAEU31_03530 [Pseudoalteromonas sp. SSMSWG5]|uniref:hypothetical protein n=1 Tax=Pseudoalteromonas sp. SSMSWG5 TaxID=3139396 RepID=UPI003BA878B8
MDSEKKIEFLTTEILNIKQSIKDGSKISDDSRKAIIHDITLIQNESRNKRFGVFTAIMAIVISFLSYIGYQSIKQAVSEEVTKSELKEKILLELTKERKELSLDIRSISSSLEEISNYEKSLQLKYEKLQQNLEIREKKVHHLINVLSKSEIDTLDFEQLIDRNFKYVLPSIKTFDFIKALGISEHSVIKVLTVYVYDFEPSNITRESLKNAIITLQNRFSLTNDGELGPCTSLVIGALLISDFPFVANEELSNSKFISQPWLTNSFQACSRKDKEYISRYLEYPDLPLHKQLNNFVDATKIDREILIKSLRNFHVDNQGYKALEYLGYGTSIE